MMENKILIGAHTSAAGGVHNALYGGKEIGATCIQFFTSNQKRWQGKIFDLKDLELWEKARKETGLTHLMSHDSYLINLGSPKQEVLEKSKTAFENEIKRCHALKLDYLNFHPGAALDSPIEECLDKIVNNLLELEKLTSQGPTRLLLETTAGQGSSIGHKFEHHAYIIDRVKGKLPIGVCMDTCHSFSAGYDLRTEEDCDRTFNEFDKIIGLEHLYAFHINDSLKPFAARKDRHANLGEGEIGTEAFRFLMTDERTRKLPKYLETPNGSKMWKGEIKLLKSYVKNK